ncbi:MAG: thioredoxin-dependent thiol peroxidase [Desulfobacterales bacterium]|nr:thioredoxin-dependent thiol peroxidase [Desulfobacterales bacterium]
MQDTLKPGDSAPAFILKNAQSKPVRLSDFAGQWVVLYFYPKDNTSGCTKEATEFSALLSKFKKQKAVVVGISPDSESSHAKFIKKHDLTVELLSDPDKQVCNIYGVWQKKKMAGRHYMGVVRTTFLIDPKGIIVRVWKKVRVKGHADDVLQACCDTV